MYQFTVLYHQPEDRAAFDEHYDEIHAPALKQIPGLLRFTASRPGPDPEGEPPAFHVVAVLDFESEAAFTTYLSSETGQAAVADFPNFAAAGATLLSGPSVEMTDAPGASRSRSDVV